MKKQRTEGIANTADTSVGSFGAGVDVVAGRNPFQIHFRYIKKEIPIHKKRSNC